MMMEILVEVGYYDYYFDSMDEAMAFARMAAEHISGRDDAAVKLTAKFTKAWVETEEYAED